MKDTVLLVEASADPIKWIRFIENVMSAIVPKDKPNLPSAQPVTGCWN